MFYSFKLCRRQQNKRSRVYHRKIQHFNCYRLEMMPILEIITLCRRCRRQETTDGSILPPQNTSFLQLLACLVSPHPRSHRGSERIRPGEGRWSRPPKTVLERSDLTEKFQFRESHTEAETKKLLTKSPSPQKKKSLYKYYKKNTHTHTHTLRL